MVIHVEPATSIMRGTVAPAERLESSVRRASRALNELRVDIAARLERLAADVDHVRADAGFHQLLRGIVRLSEYSFFNQERIAGACPNATAVMGRRSWEALGRQIRENERPIEIFAPSRPGGGGWPFLFVPVFDISQTDGTALPTIDAPRAPALALAKIEAAAVRLGIEVETVREIHPRSTGARAIGEARGGRVLIVDDLAPAQRAATLVHEYAHELLHAPGTKACATRGCLEPKSVRETEAQATAFVVLEKLGIPAVAPGYIAWQGGEGKTVLASMKRIDAAARSILGAADGRIPRIRIPISPCGPAKSRQG